jgi:hypothetical protein
MKERKMEGRKEGRKGRRDEEFFLVGEHCRIL